LKKRSIIDTPRRVRIIKDVETLHGNVPSTGDFQAPRRLRGLENELSTQASLDALKDLKKEVPKCKLNEANPESIETFENTNFELGTKSYKQTANALGFSDALKR